MHLSVIVANLILSTTEEELHTSQHLKSFAQKMRLERVAVLFFSSLFLLSVFVRALKHEIKITGMSKPNDNEMKVVAVRKAQVTHPTGDPNFSVMQAFPAGFTAKESDPFLMCDAFGPTVSDGVIADPDKFHVQWHPHRGMDILTYLVEGVGRHADSLGNRGEYASPGMQWISVVSLVQKYLPKI